MSKVRIALILVCFPLELVISAFTCDEGSCEQSAGPREGGALLQKGRSISMGRAEIAMDVAQDGLALVAAQYDRTTWDDDVPAMAPEPEPLSKCIELGEWLKGHGLVKSSAAMVFICQEDVVAHFQKIERGCLYLPSDKYWKLFDRALEHPNPWLFLNMFQHIFFAVEADAPCPTSIFDESATSQGNAIFKTCADTPGFISINDTCIEAKEVGILDKITVFEMDGIMGAGVWESALVSHGVSQEASGTGIGKMPQMLAQERAEPFESGFQAAVKVQFVVCDSIKQHVTEPQLDEQIAIMNTAYAGEQSCPSNPAYGVDPANVDLMFERMETRISTSDGCNNCRDSAQATLISPHNSSFVQVTLCDAGGVLGYAHFPSANNAGNMLVVDYRTIPGGSFDKFNGGLTLVHESGHYFALYHTFQGGCSGGDQTADTEAEDQPYYGCSASTWFRDSCEGGKTDPIHNFMDYSDDACMCAFTPQQRTRMIEAIKQFRPELVGYTPPPPPPPCSGVNCLRIEVACDNYPEETGVKVTNNCDDTVFGPYLCVDGKMSVSLSADFQQHNYTVTATDTYGDGFCCGYGQGHMEVFYEDVSVWNVSEFGYSVEKKFGSACSGETPPATMPPATMPPATMPPATMPPSTMPPATMPPSTMPLSTMPLSTMPPATMPPATMPPATMPPATMPPVAPAMPCNAVRIELFNDYYPEEVSYSLTNLCNGTSTENFDLQGDQTRDHTLMLPAGNWSLKVKDTWGDGFGSSDGSKGYLKLSVNGVSIWNLTDFEEEAEKTFGSSCDVFNPICLAMPPATMPPATMPPATMPPATMPPATMPPATMPPATIPPATMPPVPACMAVQIELFNDHYSNEVSYSFWNWCNHTNTGTFDLQGAETRNHTLLLPPANWRLKVEDTWGDGFGSSDGSRGALKLSVNGEPIWNLTDFDSAAEKAFGTSSCDGFTPVCSPSPSTMLQTTM